MSHAPLQVQTLLQTVWERRGGKGSQTFCRCSDSGRDGKTERLSG